ncbi:hypothetical protein Tco_0508868 [Tanacetum coccineum]
MAILKFQFLLNGPDSVFCKDARRRKTRERNRHASSNPRTLYCASAASTVEVKTSPSSSGVLRQGIVGAIVICLRGKHSSRWTCIGLRGQSCLNVPVLVVGTRRSVPLLFLVHPMITSDSVLAPMDTMRYLLRLAAPYLLRRLVAPYFLRRLAAPYLLRRLVVPYLLRRLAAPYLPRRLDGPYTSLWRQVATYITEETCWSLPPEETSCSLPLEETCWSLPPEETGCSLPPKEAGCSLSPKETLLLSYFLWT